jgi:hypothetical protein
MTTPEPDRFPRALLAAYADGELDAECRAEVERWLVEHPEALPELLAQREFSPANAPLWARVEPPEPSPVVWASVRRGIEEVLTAPAAAPASRGHWRAAGMAFCGLLTAGVAAAVAWVAFTAPPPEPTEPVDVVQLPPIVATEIAPFPRAVVPSPLQEPVAGFAVLPMASDDDVVLERVPETRTGWLPVGELPFSGSLVLASVEEVHLEEVEPSPAWPTGAPRMTTAPGDTPMIFAAKPR